MRALEGLTINANVEDVLAKLKQNRENHVKIVAEAREGYVAKARQVLEEKLVQLKEGKVTDFSVYLQPPVNYTSEYDTIITMLELSTDQTISLSASQVRRFVNDDWEWKNEFLGTNAMYSNSAAMSVGASNR